MGEAKRGKLLAAAIANDGKQQGYVGEWPLSNASTAQRLEAWFTSRGIDPANPGLHDTAAFLRAEGQDPKVLNLLARWVEARTYKAADLAEAECKIRVASRAVAQRVASDGRHGLCVVASGVLSRMLDELGVWNYVAKSNLAIHFPPVVSDEPRYFYSIDEGQFAAPHAIVVAPPYTVVDVTVRHQFYDVKDMVEWLPAMVMSKELHTYKVGVHDLVSPDSRADIRAHGMTVEQYLRRHKSDMLELMRELPAREVSVDGGRFCYGLVGVGGYQERLRELCGENCRIDGMTPADIFDQDVLPHFLAGGA